MTPFLQCVCVCTRLRPNTYGNYLRYAASQANLLAWEGVGIIFPKSDTVSTHTRPTSMTAHLSSTTSYVRNMSLYMQAVSTAFVA